MYNQYQDGPCLYYKAMVLDALVIVLDTYTIWDCLHTNNLYGLIISGKVNTNMDHVCTTRLRYWTPL